MKIAFDAKRAFQNATGLGNYSRTLISSLATYFPEHSYYLCAPKITDRFGISPFANLKTIVPADFASRQFKSLWRSRGVVKDLRSHNIDVYHGLSHEIPVGIQRSGVKSVVTIHDLIFERYPQQYNWFDRQIYRSKFKYACDHANKIIAISQQTKEDIKHYYKIPENKIEVCYQSCNPAFAATVNSDELERVKKRYNLPGKFFLYVGSVIERKNLISICKALTILKNGINIPLVVIGSGTKYKQKVVEYCKQHNLQEQVRFISDDPLMSAQQGYKSAEDFPAIYQQALCLVYPSIFEGFGIPILEALWSRLPVITSNGSCLRETGGSAAMYVDPYSPEDLARAMLEVADAASLRESMREKGRQHAQNFSPHKCAASVMEVYLSL